MAQRVGHLAGLAGGQRPADLLRGEDGLLHSKGYGYAYKKTDTWILNEMIHNNTPNATKVRLTWDLDFIPKASPLARTVTQTG
ncbi:MAG TPA: hypothetical protein VNT03_18035 [Baekduia sp.]|nr:hypothetical protein [Baekduia sp.]